METARGAGVLCTLGATLTALVSFSTAHSQPIGAGDALPNGDIVVVSATKSGAQGYSLEGVQLAQNDVQSLGQFKGESQINGINAGDLLGINAGDLKGINAGDLQGINAGDLLGINAGDALGINAGDLLGINAGDLLGINAGDVLGINAGDALGINAGDVLGINAGDLLGINAGDALGINAGDLLGINAGDLLGINAGDLLGINAGDLLSISVRVLRGINAGDLLGINAGDVLGINAGDLLGINAGDAAISMGDANERFETVLTGPVESIDLVNGVFTSMGQTVVASTAMLRGLTEGDYVSVDGSVMGAGWLYADAVSVSDDMYVPGASTVFVTGIMSDVDETLGSATIGDLTIDYTPALSAGSLPTGNMFSFSGIQPVEEGILLSSEVLAAE